MSAERLNELADRIEGQPNLFAMNKVGNPSCGSPGCIEGHAWALWREHEDWRSPIAGEPRKAFDVDADIWRELTRPRGKHVNYLTPNPASRLFVDHKRAAAQVRHLAKTGKVDWSATP